MTKKRRLPILVEESVGQVEVLRNGLAEKFERTVQAAKRVTCSPGCASCCYHPVSISILEGIPIYRWLARHGKWTLRLKEKLRESADMQFGTTFEVWLMALIPCPLLNEENRCSVYEARPLICRAYYAVSDPYYCHPHRLGDDTKIVPRDEVVDAFHAEQEKVLRRNKLQLLTMPIGHALLLAERVCTGDIDLDTIDAMMLKKYVENG